VAEKLQWNNSDYKRGKKTQFPPLFKAGFFELRLSSFSSGVILVLR